MLVLEDKYCMTSRATLIHSGAPEMHSLLRYLNVLEDVLRCEHRHGLRVEYLVGIYFQVLRLHVVLVSQQVVQTLHVYLKVIHLDFE